MSFKIAEAFVEVTTQDDTAAGARRIEDRLNRIRGTAHVDVDVDDRGIIRARASAVTAGRDISRYALIGAAGLTALGASGGVAAAVLAALPALAGAGLQGIAALAVGFSGGGDAVKAYGAEQDSAAKASTKGAATEVSNARQIRDAQQSIADARRQQARAAEDARDRIEAAQRDEAQASRDGAEAIAAASRQVDDALEREQKAQEDLTAARADAQRQLESLQEKVHDYALDQEGAAIRVVEAQQKLDSVMADATATDLDRRKAQYDLATAQERVRDLTREQGQAQTDLADAERKGVEGSGQVVTAQGRVADAHQGVIDAQANLVRTQRDASKAQQEAARRVAKAVEDGAQAQEDAAMAVSRAMQSLTDVQQSQAASADVGVAATSKYAQAMAKLSPEGRQFVKFITGEFLPGLRSVRDEVQASTLPRMETSLRNLEELTPIVSRGLADTGRVIGDLSIQGSQMVTSGPWKADFATIMAGNNLSLMHFGEAGLSVLDVIRNLAVAGQPLVQRFAEFTEKSSAAFQAFIQGKRDTGELQQWFHDMGDELAIVGHVLAQVAVAGGQLAGVLNPLGISTLQLVGDVAELIGNLAQADPVLASVVVGAVLAAPVITRLGTAFEFLSKMWTGLSGPALAKQIETAALSAGVLTERFTGSADAGEKVASAGDRVSTTVGKLGSALPVLGVALIAVTAEWEAHSNAVDDAAQALLKGGVAADQVTQKLQEMDQESASGLQAWNWIGKVREWIGLAPPTGQALSEVTDRTTELRNAMDPLTRAQNDATRAQNDYLLVLQRFPADSDEARAAQQRFKDTSAEVTHQQDLLKRGLEGTTDSLKRQQDQVLSAVEADIRYGDTLKRATDAVRDNGRITDLSTESGRRNQQALIDLARAAQGEEDAMRANGATVDQVRIKHEQHRQQLIAVAQQMGFNRDEAQRLTDKYLAVPPRIDTQFLANTFPAVDAVNRMAGDISRAVAGIQDEQIILRFGADTGNILAQARAQGGPIFGPGTETSDSIPALLSTNEHVWSAAEVRGAGGHDSVAMMRKMAAAGRLPGFAAGGPVAWNSTGTVLSQGIPDVVAANVAVVKALAAANMGPPPGAGGSGVERWRGVGLQALSIAGQSAANIDRLLMQMRTESGGNPYAINKTDINWQHGTPSIGLMQVIGPTYARWKVPQYDTGPYAYGVSENPLSNILASTRYTLGRYGSLAAGWQGHGYDSGGMLPPGMTLSRNATGRPERVLSADQTAAFDRLVDAITGRRSTGQGVTVNVTQTSGSPAETGRFVALALRTVG